MDDKEYGIVTTYAYDPLNRLVKATVNRETEITYSHDAAGNLVRITTSTAAKESVFTCNACHAAFSREFLFCPACGAAYAKVDS